MVENEVITDPRYQKTMTEYLSIKKDHGMLQAGREAFTQRKEMLISLGANYRAEGNADPVILQEVAKQKAVAMARARAQQKVTSFVKEEDDVRAQQKTLEPVRSSAARTPAKTGKQPGKAAPKEA